MPAWAVAPTVRLIQPVGGQRGTEVKVTLTGQRLADIQEILFYQPGITVTQIVGGNYAQAVVTFKIAEVAELGLHDFRVRTATGISSLKTFSVGTLRDVAEVEPNNDFARPQVISMNVTVNGVAGKEDIDYYEVRAKKGERITVEVEGIRLGLTLFDPYVAILNAKRFELASSDDNALIWQDCFVSLVAPEDGPYIIAVREAAFAGNPQCLYRLHVGNFPRPTATLPAGGKVGEHLRDSLDRRRAGRNHDRDRSARPCRSPFWPVGARFARLCALPEPVSAQPIWQHDRGRAQRHPRSRHSVCAPGRTQRSDRKSGGC